MAWVTPKEDWTTADGILNTDMNRIESNIAFIATNPSGVALQLAPDGGNTLIGSSTDNLGKLQVTGHITAGDSGATAGSLQMAGYYTGSDILNTYGSHQSSGATTIGYAVRAKAGSAGYTSTAGNAAFAKGVIVLDDKFDFLNSTGATIPIGTDVAMTSRFRINGSGNVLIGSTTDLGYSKSVQLFANTTASESYYVIANPDTGGVGTSTKLGLLFSLKDDSAGRTREIAGSVVFEPTENWTASSYGADLNFKVMQDGVGVDAATALKIKAESGNVLIGTTSDLAKLHVDGSFQVTGTTDNTIIDSTGLLKPTRMLVNGTSWDVSIDSTGQLTTGYLQVDDAPIGLYSSSVQYGYIGDSSSDLLIQATVSAKSVVLKGHSTGGFVKTRSRIYCEEGIVILSGENIQTNTINETTASNGIEFIADAVFSEKILPRTDPVEFDQDYTVQGTGLTFPRGVFDIYYNLSASGTTNLCKIEKYIDSGWRTLDFLSTTGSGVSNIFSGLISTGSDLRVVFTTKGSTGTMGVHTKQY